MANKGAQRGQTAAPAQTPVKSLKIIQNNVDRRVATHDVITNRALRNGVDILLINEPNKKLCGKNGWLSDTSRDAAIVFLNKGIVVCDAGSGDGFAWAELSDAVIYSCYCSPNVGRQRFEGLLADLDRDIRTRKKHVIVGGDFNAKAREWGSPVETERGRLLMDWLSEADLVVLNQGSRPTFVRQQQKSYIDITICTENAARNIKNWRVVEEETLGWHRIIEFEYLVRKVEAPRVTTDGWRISPEGLTLFREKFSNSINRAAEEGKRLLYDNYIDIVTRSCDEAFPRKKTGYGRRKGAYWWCPEVNNKRKECMASRRRMTREHRRGTEESKEAAAQEYRRSRKCYNKEINRAKRRAWEKLLGDLDDDEWGQGYRMVVKRTGMTRENRMSGEQQMAIARQLFPVATDYVGSRKPTTTEATPFSMEDLQQALSRMKKGRAPGPDGVTAEIANAAVQSDGEAFLNIANDALRRGHFPERMKVAKLTLIPKNPGGTVGKKTYRPISLLGVFSKLLEAMVETRLGEEIRNSGDLHPRQHGFRRGRSAICAVQEVIEIAREATDRAAQHKQYCALVTLDVKNAFNTARWSGILQVLEERKIDRHLVEVVRSYLSDRTLIVGGTNTVKLTCGVPQGSVLGPLLWNVYYDGVLGVEVPDGTTLVGYADDLALVTVARSGSELTNKINTALVAVTAWLKGKGLQLAPEKTEVVLLSGRRKLTEIEVTVGNNKIRSSRCVKYLGVTLDKDLRMREHVRRITDRANEVATKLGRLMPNIGGPRASKRRVLSGAVGSIILYAAPVWGGVLREEKYRNMVLQVQRRMALRICAAYRTVSSEALQVLAGVIPMDLQVKERMHTHGNPDVKDERRKYTMEEWQSRWDGLRGKAEWTRTLIQDIGEWVERKHGEVNFHMCQILTGHGCFRSYLHKIKRAENSTCSYCREEEDTARHTFYDCSRWEGERQRLALEVGVTITPNNTIRTMIGSPTSWEKINTCMKKIMEKKERDEREEEKKRMNNSA